MFLMSVFAINQDHFLKIHSYFSSEIKVFICLVFRDMLPAIVKVS